MALPFTVIFNTTGQDSPLEDATHGFRASFNESPTLSLGTRNAKFFITQGNISYYFDLHHLGLNSDAGRSILAFHALAGLAQGAGQYSLPPDQRFYAGGSGTYAASATSPSVRNSTMATPSAVRPLTPARPSIGNGSVTASASWSFWMRDR